MNLSRHAFKAAATSAALAIVIVSSPTSRSSASVRVGVRPGHKRTRTITRSTARDVSQPLLKMIVRGEAVEHNDGEIAQQSSPPAAPILPPVITTPPGSEKVEQKSPGTRGPA